MLVTQMEYHKPVLLTETVEGLNIQPNGVYVDVTFGGGGHAKEILKRLGAEGKLIAFDQDKDALENAIDDPRFLLINENFRNLKRFLRFYGHKEVDGILGDFGVSSHQFDAPERGFSTRFEANHYQGKCRKKYDETPVFKSIITHQKSSFDNIVKVLIHSELPIKPLHPSLNEIL